MHDAHETAKAEIMTYQLDIQRRRLEENVQKLRKSIQTWQAWEAEYESLEEELQALGGDASSSALEDIGDCFEGELLDQKEVRILLRDDRKQPRTSTQVIGLLTRRMEYVRSNIKSLHGSLQAAEDKLRASQACSALQQTDEEGFPLMEIQEKLDENDNVISSSMTPANEAAPQIVEALRKAGIPTLQDSKEGKMLKHTSGLSPNDSKAPKEAEKIPSALKQINNTTPSSSSDQQTSPSTSESDTKGGSRKSGRRRKSVTFADGTKQAPPTPAQPRPARDVQAAKAASTARRIKAEVRGSIDALKKVHEAGYINEEVFDRFRKEYLERLQDVHLTTSKQPAPPPQSAKSEQRDPVDKTTSAEEFNPVIPAHESPEDAALRREMIHYNMGEVGAVVAEINLEEEDQSHSSSPEDSTEQYERRGSSDDDENDWGLSINRALTTDYIKEMQALERKLKTRSHTDARPSVETLLQAEDGLMVGRDGVPVPTPPRSASIGQHKKAVRFAQELDMQERPRSPNHYDRCKPEVKKASTSIQADVVERPITANGSPSITTSAPIKKASRFKATRSAQIQSSATPKKTSHLQMTASNRDQAKTPSLPAFRPSATPKMASTGPPGRTHAPNVIERPYSEDVDSSKVVEPDEFDASLMRQELTMDYHRTRNRMIQRQGGFLPGGGEGEAEESGPLVDENGKKISRFKAARLQVGGA
ncbi:MAG: hypothetical protein LQ341_003892 [Variospora aurantia]|nr:MAG: hypothetical protein LQ341_003892 [Variospora aurantia]